jgi:hypothetical protein
VTEGLLRQRFPLQSLLKQPLLSVFRISSPPPHENALGGWFYILEFLGQAEQYEMKMDVIGGPRPKQAWVAWPGASATWSRLTLVASLVEFLCSGSHDKILTPKKS